MGHMYSTNLHAPLANAIATGCILYVLITILGPLSDAHFNPAVTLAFRMRGEITTPNALGYVAAQVIGGILGVWLTHLMFEGAHGRGAISLRGHCDLRPPADDLRRHKIPP